MSLISKATRAESYLDIQINKHIRYTHILNCLAGGKEKTAKEIAVELFELEITNSTDRNQTAPRLTELVNKNIVEVVGKKRCKWSGKTVSVYKMKEERV